MKQEVCAVPEAPHPERASQLSVRKLRCQFQVLEADLLPGSLVPGKQHGQLKGRDLQVVLPHFVLEGDLTREGRAVKEYLVVS